ncbi:MAG: UDP-N-acetylmuramoyl-tripeptide--D-alanyl-D-alanine ligase [Bacteroidales bacterium]|nr:UDP-N-acetylmuramoyl-tripeptide--D-alanyl-D-alanine ligase [Bacteroidales bacterium]
MTKNIYAPFGMDPEKVQSLYDIFLTTTGVTTDTRTLSGGEMFFALKGENFDGNLYALQALEKGAAYAVVDKGSEASLSTDPRIIAVDNTLLALKAMARCHRESIKVGGRRLTVVGLTGTNGKTTTKELIREVLASKFRVSATKGNLNNDVGVPLTVLSIPKDAQIAVVEMGASHPGDIAALVPVCAPDYGLITNVGKAHLLGFGSFEGVKATKGELYDWILSNGKAVFVNSDDENLCGMAAQRAGLSLVPYGLKYWECEIIPPSEDNPYLFLAIPEGVEPNVEIADGQEENMVLCRTSLVGSYNAPNVLAALAVGMYFGVPLQDGVDAISQYVPSNNRSQMTRTEKNTLIVDAYNANPTSMVAALDNFAAFNSNKKILMIGSMGELGDDSLKEHISIVEKVASMQLHGAFFVGEEFRKALENVGKVPSWISWYPTSDDLAAELGKNPPQGAAILIKGSRSQKMENVLCKL